MGIETNIAVTVGMVLGVFFTVLIGWLLVRGRMRVERDRWASEALVQQTLMQASITTAQRDREDLMQRLLREQQQVSDRSAALERALIAEAGLRSQVEQCQQQLLGVETRLELAAREAEQLRADNANNAGSPRNFI